MIFIYQTILLWHTVMFKFYVTFSFISPTNLSTRNAIVKVKGWLTLESFANTSWLAEMTNWSYWYCLFVTETLSNISCTCYAQWRQLLFTILSFQKIFIWSCVKNPCLTEHNNGVCLQSAVHCCRIYRKILTRK